MSDFEFEVLGIPDTSGALTDHADTDIACLDSGTGELVFGIVADAYQLPCHALVGGRAPQRLELLFQYVERIQVLIVLPQRL